MKVQTMLEILHGRLPRYQTSSQLLNKPTLTRNIALIINEFLALGLNPCKSNKFFWFSRFLPVLFDKIVLAKE